jgi:hypothetical protein
MGYNTMEFGDGHLTFRRSITPPIPRLNSIPCKKPNKTGRNLAEDGNDMFLRSRTNDVIPTDISS